MAILTSSAFPEDRNAKSPCLKLQNILKKSTCKWASQVDFYFGFISESLRIFSWLTQQFLCSEPSYWRFWGRFAGVFRWWSAAGFLYPKLNILLVFFRQYRIIQVCGLRSKIFRQVVQINWGKAVALPRFFGQADGIRFKQAGRLELCGVAFSIQAANQSHWPT